MVRRIRPWMLLPLLCIWSGTVAAQSQGQLGKIVGEVRTSHGEFPPHQIQIALQLHGATVNSVYADMQGRFGFYALQPNGYRVVINDDAYYPVDESAAVNPETTPLVMLQIVLRPRENKKKEDPAGKRATGSNPYLIDPADYNKRFPKKAVKEYDKGLAAEQQHKSDEAIEHYQAALKIAPEYYPAHNNLGSLFLGRSDFKSAEEQFREAVRLDQNEAQAYFNLGNVLMLTSRYTESDSALVAGLQRRPDSAFGHFLQGCLFARTGKFEESEKSLQEAIHIDPSMSQAHLQLVNLYMQRNRKEDAIAELQSFLKAFPEAPAAGKAKDVLHRLQAENATARP